MNKQIAVMKLLPTLDIVEGINELLRELQSRGDSVLDFENCEMSLDHIEYHAAEGWAPWGKAIPSVGDGSDNLYCFFKEVSEC